MWIASHSRLQMPRVCKPYAHNCLVIDLRRMLPMQPATISRGEILFAEHGTARHLARTHAGRHRRDRRLLGFPQLTIRLMHLWAAGARCLLMHQILAFRYRLTPLIMRQTSGRSFLLSTTRAVYQRASGLFHGGIARSDEMAGKVCCPLFAISGIFVLFLHDAGIRSGSMRITGFAEQGLLQTPWGRVLIAAHAFLIAWILWRISKRRR